MRIVVAGASVAGLSSALMLARAGHEVTLVERDGCDASSVVQAAFQWKRDGIPHFHQPHAFLPRGRVVLMRELPDVYEKMLAAGALEFDCSAVIPGPRRAGDEELVALAVRRPLVEWALRGAAQNEGGIRMVANTRVERFIGRPGPTPVIEGLRTAAGEDVRGDIVIDALGRTSPAPVWIEALGGAAPAVESAPCGLIYYSRYFELPPGCKLPPGPWLTCVGPRGDLGYAMFATFVGDNGTFAIVLGIPAWDSELRVLRGTGSYMAACREIPPLREWIEGTGAQPITPVMPMGALENSIRNYRPAGGPVAIGLLPVGDAFCHTDPAFGIGLSFSLIHAAAARDVLTEHGCDIAASQHYFERIEPETRERFVMSRDLDNARNEVWKGVKLDLSRASGCYPLFATIAAGAVGVRDGEVCRKWLRRATLLDRTDVFDLDVELHRRVETAFAEVMKSGPPPKSGPDRLTLLERIHTAGADGGLNPALH